MCNFVVAKIASKATLLHKNFDHFTMEKEVLATALLLQLSVSDILFRFNPHAHKTFSLENDQTTALWLIKRKSTWINQVIDLLKLKDDF